MSYKFEAIIDYVKVEVDNRRDYKTGIESEESRFSACLYLNKEAHKTVERAYQTLKEQFPKMKSVIKLISEKLPAKSECLGDEYKYFVNVKGWVDYANFFDLYQNRIDPSTINSGDKILIQVKALKVEDPKTKRQFLHFAVQLLTVIEKEACVLFDREAYMREANKDYFDSLETYQKNTTINTEDVADDFG